MAEPSRVEASTSVSHLSTRPSFGLRVTFFSYLLLMVVGAPMVILILWNDPKASALLHSQREQIYIYSFLAGTCGGAVYAFRGFYRHHADNTLDLSRWWPWYVGRPWMSGVFTTMVIALLNAGILILQFNTTTDSAVVGLSFLVGFGFRQVEEKVRTTIDTLFASKPTIPATDPGSPDKGSGNGSGL